MEFGGHRHKVSSAEFHAALQAGYIELIRTTSGEIASNLARAKAFARLENGRLCLSPIAPHIRTSWAEINRLAPHISEETWGDFVRTYADGRGESWCLIQRFVKLVGWTGEVPT